MTPDADEDELDRIYVEPRCPKCQRFIHIGAVSVNGLGQVHIEAACTRCGPVVPEYSWE